MAHDEAVRAAAETAVRDQGHLVAQTETHECARGTQHLAHAWPALRPFVADDDYIAGLDLPAQDRLCGRLLAVEHPRAPFEVQAFLAGNLRHGTLRREVAIHNNEVAVLLD